MVKKFNEIGIVKCDNCGWIGWEGELLSDELECPKCKSNNWIKWVRTIKIEPYIKLSDLETFGKSFIKTMKKKWKKKFTPKIGLINWNQMWDEIDEKLKQNLVKE